MRSHSDIHIIGGVRKRGAFRPTKTVTGEMRPREDVGFLWTSCGLTTLTGTVSDKRKTTSNTRSCGGVANPGSCVARAGERHSALL